ncbi:MAG: MBL fold metallo-hydrolase [Proteobacteria bacterium]|nr:MBL fold metallo-hydrolase [Pseudomonadota bacterium]
MIITVWGCRGSIPTPGRPTSSYGGNTMCLECQAGDTRVIFDMGTGIRELGQAILANGTDLTRPTHILLSHTHWDHIQGFPFFDPGFRPEARFTIHGCEGYPWTLAQILADQMAIQYFPVSLDHMEADIDFKGLPPGHLDIGPMRITYMHMNHPGLAVGYRVESNGRAFVYTGDHEPFREPLLDKRGALSAEDEAYLERRFQALVDFCRGVDLLITDAQYTDEEYPDHIGWGHSPTSYAVRLAAEARVKRVLLSHHDPDHNDTVVDEIVARARRLLSDLGAETECSGARGGATIEL